jgi:hypothetical protein
MRREGLGRPAADSPRSWPLFPNLWSSPKAAEGWLAKSPAEAHRDTTRPCGVSFEADRTGIADAFGRDNVGVDALVYEKRHDGSSPPRRQNQVIRDALPLQFRPNWRIVGISVDDDFGVPETT